MTGAEPTPVGLAEMLLPGAVQQPPYCAHCGRDLHLGWGVWECNGCRLLYDMRTLAASYQDPDGAPCGQPCASHAHQYADDGEVACSPCPLPARHLDRHWHTYTCTRRDLQS